MSSKVVVLGGGVGGMSAAHEFVTRGFDVEVFEVKKVPGGKARSVLVPNSGTDGRKDLPGEHGFRFFPAFYQHLPATMKDVPYGDSGKSCFDNLRPTSRIEIARFHNEPIVTLSRFPESLDDLKVIYHDVFDTDTGLKPGELDYFAERIWQIATSCLDRMYNDYELMSWWDYVGAKTRSPAYRTLLAAGMSRSLVAAKAKEASARTIGLVQVELIAGLMEPGGSTDRVLNGPTNDVWINPWLEYLRGCGVQYNQPWKLQSLEVSDGKISSAVVVDLANPGTTRTVEGDYFVSALPVENLAPYLTPEILALDPALSAVETLAQYVRWMNGMQIYLREDVPIIHGHCLYVDTPWALTSISQAQFWPDVTISKLGDGEVNGILSVDISDWDKIGPTVKKKARDCSLEELFTEVWAQLTGSLNVCGRVVLEPSNVHSYFLDPDIEIPHSQRLRGDINLEPLFINRPDSWKLRPKAETAIPNFFLASDYVQTNTDLACMEAANEAARRSVNAVLKATGSTKTPCEIFPMGAPAVLEPWRAHDQTRYDQGLPWDGKLLG